MSETNYQVTREQNGIEYPDIPVTIEYHFEYGEPLIDYAKVSENIPFVTKDGKQLPVPYFLASGEYIDLTESEMAFVEQKLVSNELGYNQDQAVDNYKDKYS